MTAAVTPAGRLPARDFSAALDIYTRAAQIVGGDAGTPARALDIHVAERAPAPGAMAVADSRSGSIAIHPEEGKALQAVAARAAKAGVAALSPDDQADLRRRSFTALHEASHVTGPAMPPANEHSPVETVWEEALASLNARRLVPTLLGAGVERPALGSITYSGYVARVTELLQLAGVEPDTAAFDSRVRDLAERTPWSDRAATVTRQMVSHVRGREATATDLAALEPYVRSYVNRYESNTGLIERTLRDLPA